MFLGHPYNNPTKNFHAFKIGVFSQEHQERPGAYRINKKCSWVLLVVSVNQRLLSYTFYLLTAEMHQDHPGSPRNIQEHPGVF